MDRIILIALLLSMNSILAGCASYDLIKQPPGRPHPISIAYQDGGASGWSDLPLGAYRVPNSTVIISGHQGSGAGFAALFGIVGVAVADAAETRAGAAAVKDAENALQIDLTRQASLDANAILASGQLGQDFKLEPATGKPDLTVTPFTVVTFTDDRDVLPFVILKATLNADSAGGHSWTTRYIATLGKPRPLMGVNSFTANDGELLKKTLDDELVRATRAMLNDIGNQSPRDPNHMIYAEISLPYVRQRMDVPGYEIGEDNDSVVFAPKGVADAVVYAGIYVLDKSGPTFRPATSNDEIKFLGPMQ